LLSFSGTGPVSCFILPALSLSFCRRQGSIFFHVLICVLFKLARQAISPSADLRAFVCGPAAVLSASLRSCAAQPVTSSVHAASQSLLAAAFFSPHPGRVLPGRVLPPVLSQDVSSSCCLELCLSHVLHRSHFLPHKYLFWHGGCELVSSGEPTRIVTRAQALLFQALSSQYTISVLFDSPPIVVTVLVRFLTV
jgi:hypothetical protein